MIRDIEKALKSNRKERIRWTACLEVALQLGEAPQPWTDLLTVLDQEHRLLSIRLCDLLAEANEQLCNARDARRVYA